MNAPGVGCGVVLLRDDRLLLIRRRKPPEADHWSFVGGKVDFMERTVDAARRECLEETGLAVSTLSVLGVSEQFMKDDAQHWVSVLFLAQDFEGEPVIAEPDKHSALGWFALDALPSPLSHAVRDALAFMSEA